MLPDFRVRQRDYLLEISRSITEELDLNKVLTRIVRLSGELLAGHAGLIALRQTDGGWEIASSFGIQPSFLTNLKPLLADIPEHGDSARFQLPEVNRRLQRITEAASMGLLNCVGLPLIAKGDVLGAIFVFRSYRGPFSREDRDLLQSFASQAAIAVHNARLYTQVAQQNQHLDAILESSADGIFILDPGLRFERFNRSCSRLTGFAPDEVIGKEHDEIIGWRTRQQGQTLQEAVAGGWPLSATSSLYTEGDLRRRDGSTLSVGITYAPTLSGPGRLMSIVANMRDITRFREAEELKSTFISIISHELRTPVALIEDLLDASRLQAGAMALDSSEVALDAIARRLVERFRIQSEHHSFELSFPSEFPIIAADEKRLTQVLSNLLSNAVKYSPAGGKVTIKGSLPPGEVVVCVSDEGAGIAREDAPRVFDRFYRSSEAARRTKGAGLGLFLAKAVVEAHGGRIWVDDQVERGARICFSLPR